LERSANEFPHKTAVLFKDESITYSRLDRLSSALAGRLTQLGIRRGDRVGILFHKSIESIIALFAILKAGAIYVPLDPSAPAVRIRNIISNCGIKYLVTTDRQLVTSLSASEEMPAIDKAVVIGRNRGQLIGMNISPDYFSPDDTTDSDQADFHPVDMSDSSPAYILHTSGSTGNPKGVAISHLNALTFIDMAADFFEITSEDRFCSHAPLHFDLSVFDIFVAVKRGATIVLLPELYSTFPAKLAAYVASERITVWNSVSSVLKMLADKGGLNQHRFDSLRIVHFSGDLMPVKYLRILTKHMNNASFFNIYGQTEANSSMCYPIRELPDSDSWRIPIGRPFPNFEVFALNEKHTIIKETGEEGELYVGSSSVALGYWGDTSKTSDRFVPDPRCPFLDNIVYKTGDLVRIDENGDYVFTGRTDHMVKSRGYRIELSEIEIALSGHPEIASAVATAIPDDLIGNRIGVTIVRTNDSSLGKEDIIRFCALRLPRYMIPEIVKFRDSLPMTSSGKVDRKQLDVSFPASAAGATGDWGTEILTDMPTEATAG